ncbi:MULTISPECIES: hypothetical protein [unclassified Saccharothrix]|uniref:hypothetical protein n=1 Tax=unclassified Saccharothrix TaxID=2593673 RepID=UPI00307EAB74
MRAWFTEADLVAMVGEDGVARAGAHDGPISFTASPGEIDATFRVDDVEFDIRLTGAEGLLLGECDLCAEEFCEHCATTAWHTLDLVALPDVDDFLAQAESFNGHKKLSSANYEPWADKALSLIAALELGSICHPALIRPVFQRLMWHVAHTPVYFDTHEAYDTLLDLGERIVEGVAWVCAAEPTDPRELGRWTADLQVNRPDVQTPLHVSVFYDGLDDAAKAAYGERLAELQREITGTSQGESTAQAERRWRIRELREEFALDQGLDNDEPVAFYADDVDDPMREVSMAEALRSAGRLAEAIDVLERADSRPSRGDIVLAELYSATGQRREAARMWLTAFMRAPLNFTYNGLLAAAAELDAVDDAKHRALTHVTGLRDPRDVVSLVLNELKEVEWCWEFAPEHVVVLLADNLAERGDRDTVAVLARGARTAIDRRSNHALAARVLVALRRLHERTGLDFAPGFEYFTTSYGNQEELMQALHAAGL